MKTGKFKKLFDKGLDLIYPPSLYCICCGNIIDESRTYNLCDHCISHINWSGYEYKELDGIRIWWCVEYGLYARTLIFSLKYNGKKYISRDIAKIMADKLKLIEQDFDVIVPVPISKKREMQRGFNQMALIAKYLAQCTEKDYCIDALTRITDTAPMRGLNPIERKENIKGTIALNEKYGKILKDKRILLIDDFYTTGSTAYECCIALRMAKPLEISFLSFAAK